MKTTAYEQSDMQWLLENPNFTLHLINETDFGRTAARHNWYTPAAVPQTSWQPHKRFPSEISSHLNNGSIDKAREIFASALRASIQLAEQHQILEHLAEYARKNTDIEL